MSKSLQRRMARANRDGWEASASKETLVAWAEAQERWPRRRWRVEGSRAGTSALTTQGGARRLVARCGGRVVEVLESAEARRKRLAKEARAAAAAELAASGSRPAAASDVPPSRG